jgi:hypothetical protein
VTAHVNTFNGVSLCNVQHLIFDLSDQFLAMDSLDAYYVVNFLKRILLMSQIGERRRAAAFEICQKSNLSFLGHHKQLFFFSEFDIVNVIREKFFVDLREVNNLN